MVRSSKVTVATVLKLGFEGGGITMCSGTLLVNRDGVRGLGGGVVGRRDTEKPLLAAIFCHINNHLLKFFNSFILAHVFNSVKG